MVRPSRPLFMARVLDAVMNLGDSRGSSVREVLSFIRQGNSSLKNLTVQVQRALKHAVNAGLLRHRSGRYKVLATLNPAPTTPALPAKKPTSNGQKSEKRKLKSDVRAQIDNSRSSRRTQKRKKTKTSSRQNSKHSDNAKRNNQHSLYVKRAKETTVDRKRQQRKRAHEDEEFEDQLSERYVLHDRDESPVSFNRGQKRSRVSKRELESSDFSDESDCESDVNRKHVSQASTSSRREPKRKEARARSRDRSTSRARSAQRMQARQRPIEEVENDKHRCDENHGLTGTEHQEPCEDVEGDRLPDDSNSGNNLENL